MERENAELHRKQDSLMITRPEYTSQHDSLAKEFHGAVDMFNTQIGVIREWKAEIIPQLLLLNEIGPLKDWKSEQKGKASQSAVVGAYVVAVLGWLISPLVALAIERAMR